MNNLALYKSEQFNGIVCDFWKNEDNEIYMTREQIGTALEYSDPRIAIYKLHERHKDRLDKLSAVTKLVTPSGIQETYVYNTIGIYEICRWSKQTKANEFMDFVWNLLEAIRKGEIELLQKELESAKPKLEFYEIAAKANNYLTMLQASKILKMGRNKLFKILRDEKILMNEGEKHNLPYERFIKQGYFTVVVTTVVKNNIVKDKATTLVSAKGLVYIQKELSKIKKAPLYESEAI